MRPWYAQLPSTLNLLPEVWQLWLCPRISGQGHARLQNFTVTLAIAVAVVATLAAAAAAEAKTALAAGLAILAAPYHKHHRTLNRG